MVVITGSAANPPHIGHSTFVRILLADERVTGIWWSVDRDRRDKPLPVSFEHRFEMTRRLFAAELTEAEQERIIFNPECIQDATATIEQLEAAMDAWPGEDFAWAVGTDQFKLEAGRTYVERTWCRGEELITHYPYFVIPRSGHLFVEEVTLPGSAMMLPMKSPLVSSTQIRTQLRDQDATVHGIPATVLEYIHQHRLYKE